MNIRTAPESARRLVKSAPFIRRQIQQTSKSEQSGTQGATQQRERLTAEFARNVRNTDEAIAAATAAAADFDQAHMILHSGIGLKPIGPMSRLATVALRLDFHDPALTLLTAMVANRAKDAAQQATDRLDLGEPELRSTALLAQLSALLPSVKFDVKSPKVAGVRRDYLAATQIASDRRKSK